MAGRKRTVAEEGEESAGRRTQTEVGEEYAPTPPDTPRPKESRPRARIVNGKIVEGWFVTDSTDMFKQIGAIEYTEKGKSLFPEDVK